MKAAYVTAYGPPDVIEIRDIPTPVPQRGQVLVRVHVSPVTSGDMRLRSGAVPRGFGLLVRLAFGLRRPRNAVPGMGFAGTVAGLGAGVTGFALGQKVFGTCGFRGGAHAEYLVIPASGRIFPLPEGADMAPGAALFFGGMTVLDFLTDKAGLTSGQRLLVNGATGAVGTAALQIARDIGAVTTAVCRAENHALARDLGATHVHDYRSGPVSGTYDAILDVIGTLPYRAAKPLLAPGGVLLPVTGTLAHTIGAALRPRRGSHRISGGTTSESRVMAERVVALWQRGVLKPVIGDIFPLAQIRAAHTLADTMHRQGTTVLVMPEDKRDQSPA